MVKHAAASTGNEMYHETQTGRALAFSHFWILKEDNCAEYSSTDSGQSNLIKSMQLSCQ